jgi:tRNA(Arg) A34 adenosine deaminase TadA
VDGATARSGNFVRNARAIHTSVDSVLTLYDRRVDAWNELDEPWQASLELAWEAYLAGTIPVGAAVAAADGSVVARGRNRIFDPPGIGLAGSRLAHAEVDALSRLPVNDRYRDHVLYSTLEPCLLCTAATLVATVGRIEYATEDRFGGACNGAIDTVHWRRSAPEIASPLGSWPGQLSAALQSAFWQAHPEHRRSAEIVELFGVEAERAGAQLLGLDSIPSRLDEALPRLLDCL